jgi:serine/threonine protein kinase
LQESPLSFDESAGFTAPSAFGTYRVLHQIGSGVLGPVFRTYDPQRDRLVAIKAFRLDIVPELVAKLADSLRRLVGLGLTHDAIVAPLDAGLEGTTAYLAMEYVAAETLDVALRHLAPMPLDRALPLLSQGADAIAAGWAAGVGHGALHPRDMFVALDTNDIRVSGFGVAPALEALGIRAPVRRPYTAPERATGERWDERADVYSLGSIAHELLTRRRPGGAGEQDGALTTDTSAEQRVMIRRVLAVALAERPQDRFVTARAFVDALAAVARGELVALAEPHPASAIDEAPPRESKRRPKDVETPLFARMDEPPESVAIPEPKGSRLHVPESAAIPEPEGSGHPDPKPGAPDLQVRGDLELPSSPKTHAPSPPSEPEPAPEPEPALETSPPDHAPGSRMWPAGPPPEPEPKAEPALETWHPSFAPSQEVHAPFPWSAIVAATVAGVMIGAVGGYRYGRLHDVPPPADTVTTRPADTDVSVPEPARRAETPPTDKPVEAAPPAARASAPRPVPPAVSAARKPAARPSPRSATRGSIFVDSRPRAARVIIDGRFVGLTPLSIPELTLGGHSVRLDMAGHRSFSTRATVKAGEQTRVTAALEER